MIRLSRLTELLAQAIQRPLLTAHTEERAFFIGALFQHFAAREYYSAQLLAAQDR